MNLMLICLILLLASWGSFLNFLAYRLVHDMSFRKQRSICPNCKTQLAWYDLFPIFSWLYLTGKCRTCQKPISLLYPIIELLTVTVGLALFYLISPIYWLAYFVFFSALIVTIRTDLQTMLISRFVTLFLLPVPIILSLVTYHGESLLPITTNQVLLGASIGYLILYLINKFFWLLTSKDGMGQGDMDLLCLIGSFTGIYGAWICLMLSSMLGSIFGISLIILGKSQLQAKLPFGPFLALSAIIYTLFQNQILTLIFS